MSVAAVALADGELRATGRAPALRLAPDARSSLDVALRTAHAAAVTDLVAAATALVSPKVAMAPAALARLAWICERAPAEVVGNPDGSAVVTLTLPAATVASLRSGPRRVAEVK
ncbi:MAG: hypothetical protein IPL79_03705 [Myxococcales bacterium]|nr:hypothetical protein [Myxococcales bacterium]